MDRRLAAITSRQLTFRFQQVGHGTLAWIRWCWSPPPRYFQKISALRVRRERRTHWGSLRGFNHCLGYHIACTHHIVSGTVSKTVSKLWKLFGNFWGENDQNPSSMSTPSVLDLVSATPEILGSTTHPASAMAQIDPAPPAELVDPVSASPLEPFANPDAARNEPGMVEPKIKIDGEHSTMAADGLLDPAAACAARRASACLS